ncbi:MAG TPA: hypothetical protein VI198_02065 [Candidatus Eisenbacteria bacterium]
MGQVAKWTIVVAAAFLSAAGAPAGASDPPAASVVLIPGRVIVAPGKTLAQARNLDPDRVLFFRGSTTTFQSYEFPRVAGKPSAAALSASGKLLAIASDSAVSLVEMAELKLVRTFPPALSIRWNRDGSRLAMLETNPTHAGSKRGELSIWNKDAKEPVRYGITADDMEWGPGDSLFLGTERGVEALAAGAKRLVSTRHHGVDVSPDSRYSIRRDPSGEGRFAIFHDRSGLALTTVTTSQLGEVTAETDLEPFWLRAPGARHVICVSRWGVWASPDSTPAAWGTRTGFVDVTTSELLYATPGIAVGRSADRGSAWIFDGWSHLFARPDGGLFRNSVRNRDQYGGEAGEPVTARIRIAFTWGSGRGGRLDERREEQDVDVQEGDFLPFWREYPLRLSRQFRVTRIISKHEVELQVDPSRYTVQLPGDRSRHLTYFEVGRAPVTIEMSRIEDAYFRAEVHVPH